MVRRDIVSSEVARLYVEKRMSTVELANQFSCNGRSYFTNDEWIAMQTGHREQIEGAGA